MDDSRLGKKVLACAVCAALSTGTAAYAAEDAGTGQSSASNLGQITVTGSRIKRTSAVTAQPVQVINNHAIQMSGFTSVGQLLQSISTAGASISLKVNNGNTGGGQYLDLRYLGSQRVLVLVNGKRWIAGSGGSVDLSTIPMSIVDHVEILQDGASAIYGSDAIAGVVNIITKKNFNGIEANAYYGEYFEQGHRDGAVHKYNVTIGTHTAKSGLLFNAEYLQQDPVLAGDRDYSSEPLHGTGVTRGSSYTPQGRFDFYTPPVSQFAKNGGPLPASDDRLFNICDPATVGGANVLNCSLTVRNGAHGTSAADFRPFVAEDHFNFAPQNNLIQPFNQKSAYLNGHYDLTSNISFVLDTVYTKRSTQALLAPAPIFFGPGTGIANIPPEQPYNPFGFPLNTTQNGAGIDTPNLLFLGRRSIEAGPRTYTNEVNTFRISYGLNGQFLWGTRVWNWDVGEIYGYSDSVSTTGGIFDVGNLTTALGDPAGCQPTPGCVPYNVFGGIPGSTGPFPARPFPGSITPAMNDYATVTLHQTTHNKTRIWDADISSSDIADLPAGPVGVALGYQYNNLSGSYSPDPIQAEGRNSDAPGNLVQAVSGSYDVNAVYGEINIPLLAHLPGAYELSTDIATRHSRYSTFGSTTDSRIGFKYQPIDGFLLRGTWSQGFRAPTINDLFSGQLGGAVNVSDPCSQYTMSGVSQAVQQNCRSAGVPSTYEQRNLQLNVVSGSNPSLQPETSISRTVGFMYSPTASLSFYADYYDIEIDGQITTIGGQNILDGCYIGGVTSYCELIARAPGGHVNSINNTEGNFGKLITHGWTGGGNYTLPQTGFGQFSISGNFNYVSKYADYLPNANGPGFTVQDHLGKELGASQSGVPYLKANVMLKWNMNDWEVGITSHFISGLTERCSDFLDGTQYSLANLGLCSNPNLQHNPLSTNDIGAVVWEDGYASYDFSSNLSLTVGVLNLFDKQPPRVNTGRDMSVDAYLYGGLVGGRFPYVQVSARF